MLRGWPEPERGTTHKSLSVEEAGWATWLETYTSSLRYSGEVTQVCSQKVTHQLRPVPSPVRRFMMGIGRPCPWACRGAKRIAMKAITLPERAFGADDIASHTYHA